MKPLLLLIPGMTNTPRVWDATRAHLKTDVELRVTDIRSSVDIAAMAATAWGELADVDASRPLALAGFSLGGFVALQMIATAARPVQGLALVCSTARPDDPANAPMRERAIASAQRDWERYITTIAKFLSTPETQAQPALMEAILSDLRQGGVEATVAQHRASLLRPDHRALLPRLRMRTLVIAGALDPLIPPAQSREAAEAIPGALWREVEAAGHLLPWERPQVLAQAMDEWLSAL